MREVMGLADTWWRGPDSLVALYSAEAAAAGVPGCVMRLPLGFA